MRGVSRDEKTQAAVGQCVAHCTVASHELIMFTVLLARLAAQLKSSCVIHAGRSMRRVRTAQACNIRPCLHVIYTIISVIMCFALTPPATILRAAFTSLRSTVERS